MPDPNPWLDDQAVRLVERLTPSREISGLLSAALYTLTVLGAFGIAYGLASAFGLYLVPLF